MHIAYKGHVTEDFRNGRMERKKLVFKFW